MYREMTPEEKLEYAKETFEALCKNGLLGAEIVHEQWKIKLSGQGLDSQHLESSIEKTIDKETLRLHEQAMKKEKRPIVQDPFLEQYGTLVTKNSSINNVASIYAEEHIQAVEEDLREQSGKIVEQENISQAKVKVLEQNSSDPWGDAREVVPGAFKKI